MIRKYVTFTKLGDHDVPPRVAWQDELGFVRDAVSEKSLMPAGLADQLHSRGEFLDLVKFISALGKPGEYANDESCALTLSLDSETTI